MDNTLLILLLLSSCSGSRKPMPATDPEDRIVISLDIHIKTADNVTAGIE